MIIVRLKGGMGNQLFQYALGRALALKNKTEVGLDISFYNNPGFPIRTYDLDLFNINAKILSRKEIPFFRRSYGKGLIGRIIAKIRTRLLPNVGTERGFVFNKKIFAAGSSLYLDGYWQNPAYFEKYTDTIRKDFEIIVPLSSAITALQKEIEECISVCMHVRRGDYVGNTMHDVVTPEYYRAALDLLKTKVSTIDRIYMFSDDPRWCEQTFQFNIPITFVGEEYAGERASGHFVLMQSCKHFIIPNSSFSWWTAWLGKFSEKIVIAPKQWFGDLTIDTSDRTPEEWIRI
jgi:hypothetical protein